MNRFAIGMGFVLVTLSIVPVVAAVENGPLLVTVSSSPNPFAISGRTPATNSDGVLGKGTRSGDFGVVGTSAGVGGAGIAGYGTASTAPFNDGIIGSSVSGVGVYGNTTGSDGNGAAGVVAVATTAPLGGIGVQSTGSSYGLYASTTADIPAGGDVHQAAGIAAFDDSKLGNLAAVSGYSPAGAGVFGESATGWGMSGIGSTYRRVWERQHGAVW